MHLKGQGRWDGANYWGAEQKGLEKMTGLPKPRKETIEGHKVYLCFTNAQSQ